MQSELASFARPERTHMEEVAASYTDPNAVVVEEEEKNEEDEDEREEEEEAENIFERNLENL